MKLKNCFVGTEVQVKDVSIKPTACSFHVGTQYNLDTERVFTISATPDEDGDVRLVSTGYGNPQADNRSYIYVHHSNLRRVNK